MANGMADSETANSLAPVARRGASLSLAKTAEGTEELARSKADPRRAALTAALGRYPQYFGQPRTSSEWALWNKRLTSLLAGGLVPADVGRAVNAWKRKYPQAQLTINALDLHLGELLPAPVSAPAPISEFPVPHPTPPAPAEEIEHHATHDEREHSPSASDTASTPAQLTDEEREQRRRAAVERGAAEVRAAKAARAAAALVPSKQRVPARVGASL